MSKALLPNSTSESENDSEPIVAPSERKKCRIDFTASQIHDFSIELAKKTRDLRTMEDEKSSVTSQYGSKIKTIKGECNLLSDKISDGYEIQDVECTIKYHFPEKNKKTYTRTDNGQHFTEPMDSTDHNLFNQESDVNEDDDGFMGRHSYKNKKKKK